MQTQDTKRIDERSPVSRYSEISSGAEPGRAGWRNRGCFEATDVSRGGVGQASQASARDEI